MDFHDLGRLDKAGREAKRRKCLKKDFCYQLKHQVSKQIRECEELKLPNQLCREFRLFLVPDTRSIKVNIINKSSVLRCCGWRKASLSISVHWCSLLFKYSTSTRSFAETRIWQDPFWQTVLQKSDRLLWNSFKLLKKEFGQLNFRLLNFRKVLSRKEALSYHRAQFKCYFLKTVFVNSFMK